MSYFHPDIKNEGAKNADVKTFENLYIQLRKKEQRLYTDDEVFRLPQIATAHPHFKEWVLRKRSCDRLIEYLAKKDKPLNILEIGCGNGWLSAQLAKNIAGQVVGMDINMAELEQAIRIFHSNPNLKFIPGDICFQKPGDNRFDVIVFGASIQYFPSIKEILQAGFLYLNHGGEVHIIDTIFYNKNNVDAARQRSKDYYTTLGFPSAAGFYFHHCIEDLEKNSIKTLYNPSSWIHKLTSSKNPFYWICVKNR